MSEGGGSGCQGGLKRAINRWGGVGFSQGISGREIEQGLAMFHMTLLVVMPF